MKETSGKQRRAPKQRASFGSSCLLGWKLVRRKGAAAGRAVWYHTVMNLACKMKMKKIWRLSQIIAWVGVTHPGQMPLMTSTLTQTIEWIGLDGDQSNHFTYLRQSERHFCQENNCFLFLIKKKVQKLLTDSLKDTSASSDLSRDVLCLQQTAAWASVMPRPYLLVHIEVLPVHIYVRVKMGGSSILLKIFRNVCECELINIITEVWNSSATVPVHAYGPTPSTPKLAD